MVRRKLSSLFPATPVAPSSQALAALREALLSGRHWYLALLEAIGKWSAPEETYRGRHYRYLIGGEAFDWLLLAERLCPEVDGLLPQKEKENLLLQGRPPLELSPQDFKRLLGSANYRAYLNFFYGVTVEGALLAAVEEEVQKERQPFLCPSREEAYQRIYGAPRRALHRRFQEEKGYAQSQKTGPTDPKEFTYWLFKYRLRHCERAKVASDTQKGLAWLQGHGLPFPRSPWVKVREGLRTSP